MAKKKLSKEKTMNKQDEKYTKEKVINFLEKHINSEKLPTLYKKTQINRSGSPNNSNELYSEIMAKYLLDRKVKHLFEEIKPISRHDHNKKYIMKSHKPLSSDQKKSVSSKVREEEWYARFLYRPNEEFDCIGEVIDYQTPIKGNIFHVAGKVDLLAYKKKEKLLSLIELKMKREDEKEGMLRAILEICTYYYQIDKEQLKEELLENSTKYPAIEKTQMAVLIFKGSRQHKEYEKPGPIQQLVGHLGVKVLIVENIGDKITITDITKKTP